MKDKDGNLKFDLNFLEIQQDDCLYVLVVANVIGENLLGIFYCLHASSDFFGIDCRLDQSGHFRTPVVILS